MENIGLIVIESEYMPEPGEQQPKGTQEICSPEEMARRQAESGQGRRRFEVLRLCDTPGGITWVTRSIVAGEEKLDITESPSPYTRNSTVELLHDRAEEARMRLAPDLLKKLGLEDSVFGSYQPFIGEKYIGHETLSEAELKRLIDSLETNKEEFWARWRLLEAFRQLRMAGSDLEQVTVNLFTSLSKVSPEAGWLGTVGRAKETLPNAERLGTMVDNGLRAWCDIGERKVPGIDNIFGGSRFESTYRQTLDYVTNKIIGLVGQQIPEDERKYSLYWQDAQAAAILALEIFRMFDLDSAFDLKHSDIKPEDVGRWNEGLKNFLLHTPGAGAGEWDFEGGQNSGDMAKICHFILRQVNEFGRDHPRAIGAPAVVGCFPNLTVDFMRMATIELENKADRKASKKINLWTLWREKGIPFGELPWGEAVWVNGFAILKAKGLLPADAMQEQWKVKGIGQDTYDVPYTLQHYYAVSTVFSAITRKDWDRALDDAQNPNYLLGLNKGFESTFELMANGVGLDKKTMTKIRQLTKINYLVGIAVANIRDAKDRDINERIIASPLAPDSIMRRQKDANEVAQVLKYDPSIKEAKSATLEDNIINAAVRGKFFSALRSDIKNQEIKLFKNGVAKRRGFLPNETEWFDETELKEIQNSGLFGPYNKT